MEGTLPLDQIPLELDDLRRVGRMIRQIHDAIESIPFPAEWNTLIPADDPNLMRQNDVAPWKLVIGERGVFID